MDFADSPILSLKELHDITRGIQDDYVIQNKPRFQQNVIATHTESFQSPPNGCLFRHRLRMPSHTNGVVGTAYTNFKITPSSAISDIWITIGERVMDRRYLYKFLHRDIEFYEMTNGQALPANVYHENDIYFETNCECEITISYDIVTHENPDFNACSENIIYLEQCTDPIPITRRFTEISLPFNHPVIEIYAFLPQNTIDARILINDKDHNLILTKQGDYHHIWFGHETSINFSRISSAKLQLTTQDECKCIVHVVAVHKNIIRRMNGMCGLAFV
jgi:hypothetical protein